MGRLYAVERWIRGGKPLQVTYSDIPFYERVVTPLVVALENNQHDLALLLLCNGYRTDLEPHSPLDIALRRRAWDFVDLLLAWGADPTAADPDAVLDTYQLSLIERFWNLGLDLTRDRSLAYYLSESTRNKPAYGWAKRHCEDPRVAYALALALNGAVWENREKAVALLMWAGADSHRQVPSLKYSDQDDDSDGDLSSPIEDAVVLGHGKVLRYLKPDPSIDDFDELWAQACDPDAVDVLFDLSPPLDWSKAIKRNIASMAWWFRDSEVSRACLGRIFDHHWGRLNALEPPESRELRRDLLKIQSGSDFAWVMERLAKPRHCDPSLFAELVRTPAMKDRLTRQGLQALVPAPHPRHSAQRRLVAKRSRPEAQSPKQRHEAWLSSLTSADRKQFFRYVITREQLYEEVWAEPVTKVAARYGVSDVAVAKWCTRMNVPRPGRGYWARTSVGQRLKQVPLPQSTPGYEEYVHRPKPGEHRSPSPTAVPGLALFENPVPIPELSANEHPLVAMTRHALTVSAVEERAIVCPRGEQGLDLRVSQASVERALRIMNAIVAALERAGFRVEVAAVAPERKSASRTRTYAVLNDERIPFFMAEATRQVERPPTDEERAEMRRNPWTRGPFYAYRSTGELSLQIEGGWYREHHRRTWSDTKHRHLEDCLYSFFRGLLISADALKHRSEEVGTAYPSGCRYQPRPSCTGKKPPRPGRPGPTKGT